MIQELKKFKNKKVLITGHTGFKGSWLALCLKQLGANILGVSKDIPTIPSHFRIHKDLKNIKSKKIDLYSYNKLRKAINNFKPDYIFHLAAQPIVKKSLEDPIKTWKSNTFGTLNILEILREYKKKVKVIIITSDKVYFNFEQKLAYKEKDILGGKDPYSASKASAELAIKSYFESYIKNKKNISLAIARAGNVIGGGDWSEGRLIPDCIKAWSKNKSVTIRNPKSTRPWQHVLEVVIGYLILASKLSYKKRLNGEAFNFGPFSNKNYTVISCIKQIKKHWPEVSWKKQKEFKKFPEAGLLKLNSKKAHKLLGWRTILTFKDTLKITAEWYRSFYKKESEIISTHQIRWYMKKFKTFYE